MHHAGIHISSYIEGVNIWNNIIYNCGSASTRSTVIFTCDNHVTSNIKFYNNTIYSAANDSVILFDYTNNVAMKNNIIYSLSSTPYIDNVGSGTVTSDYDDYYGNGAKPAWAGSHCLSNINPLLVSPTTDFHLQATSPCKDAGTDTSAVVTKDYDGLSRPQSTGVDMGAYEYNTGTPPTDTTPPEAVNNLTAISGPNSGEITLTWTAPGDDGNSGTATTYIIKYSASAITTDALFNAAADVTGEPAPAIAGTSQYMIVTGLTGGQTYYFAMKTQDEVPNTSALSNCVSAIAAMAPDTTPPAAVTDLNASGITSTSVVLGWTAPGNDWTVGQAASYDIRWSTADITDANWVSATQATGVPTPLPAGTIQLFTVIGLNPSTTYYFALKTQDYATPPNVSGLSNIASATTSAVYSGTSGGGGGGGGCFIATATYGSPDVTDVKILRQFRNRYLLTNKWGREFVKFYNRHSPPIAEYIEKRDWAKKVVRVMLKPAVWIASKVNK